MEQKTFLMCVGAQKAGTTWLYDYLTDHEACYTGKIKEYHIFDVASQPEVFGGSQITHLKRAAMLLAKKAERPRKDTAKVDVQLRSVLNRIMMRLMPEAYLDHFRRQMRDDPSKTLFTDITPSYSGLNKATFTEIHDLFNGSEFNLRILFLMRDPLDRILSAIKMIDRNFKEENGVAMKSNTSRQFARKFATKENEIRTRYENTITNLEAVFPPEMLHFGFYETLFQEDSVRNICNFLDIAYVRPDFDRQINASPSIELPNKAAIRASRAHYDETYQFCMNRFGEQTIRKLWAYA